VKSAQMEMKRLYDAGAYTGLIRLYQDNEETLLGKIEPESQLRLAQAYARIQDYPRAIHGFLQIEPDDLNTPQRGEYFAGLAKSYVEGGNSEGALQLLEGRGDVTIEPKDQQALSLMVADIYRRSSRLDEAYALYAQLVHGRRHLPEDEISRIYYVMGQILNHKKEHEKARDLLNRCIALVEKKRDKQDLFQSALLEVGESYRGERRYAEATRAYQDAFDAGYGPDKEGYWGFKFRQAESYMAEGDAETAESVFLQISEEGDPDLQSKVQLRLGTIQLKEQLARLSLGREKREE
jgi:tetratricopeptide (TPR) repeat protein